MATISTMAVNLIAKTGVFERKMKKSSQRVRSFRSSITSASKGVLKFGVGLAAAAGAAGLGIVIKKTLDSIDVTAKLSRRLGIATEDLIAMQHAAEINGVAASALNKSIDIFIRRLGELSTGAGEATRGLQMLNLSYEQLENKSPLENIKLIADKIAGTESMAKKAAAAYFLFGRAGASLVNLFNEGAAGIERFQVEAERLNLTFSELDAVAVEEANDAITRLKASLKGVTQQFTIGIAPIIEAIASGMTEFVIANGGVADTLIGIAEAGALAFIEMGKAVADVAADLKDMAESLAFIPNLLKGLGKGLEFLGVLASGEEATRQFLNAAKMQEDLAAQGVELSKKSVKTIFDDIREKTRLIVEARKRQGASGADDDFNIEAFEKLAKEAERLKESLKEPAEKLQDIRTKLDEMFSAGLLTAGQWAKALSEAEERLFGFAKAAEEARKANESLEKSAFEKIKSKADALKESLKGPIERLKDIRGELDEMLKLSLITVDEYRKGLRKAAEDIISIQAGLSDSSVSSFVDVGQASVVGRDVDVRGLTIGIVDPLVQRADTQADLTRETNTILAAIESDRVQ